MKKDRVAKDVASAKKKTRKKRISTSVKSTKKPSGTQERQGAKTLDGEVILTAQFYQVHILRVM
uniref:Uncharacterized protein n=1 Tax=viral metagenome TaxID=1070528 RepID=A0A6H1ZDR2_9ZZZZ